MLTALALSEQLAEGNVRQVTPSLALSSSVFCRSGLVRIQVLGLLPLVTISYTNLSVMAGSKQESQPPTASSEPGKQNLALAGATICTPNS